MSGSHVGKSYWIQDDKGHIDVSPQPITNFGFDESVQRIDAAFVLNAIDSVYLFAGSKYIRCDNCNGQINKNVLGNISEFDGLPNNLDAAIALDDGAQVQFFKGNLYWLYDSKHFNLKANYPRRISSNLLRCPRRSMCHPRKLP